MYLHFKYVENCNKSILYHTQDAGNQTVRLQYIFASLKDNFMVRLLFSIYVKKMQILLVLDWLLLICFGIRVYILLIWVYSKKSWKTVKSDIEILTIWLAVCFCNLFISLAEREKVILTLFSYSSDIKLTKLILV